MEAGELKVAVVGAGPSGLACALELERWGIKPVVYERCHRVGHPAEMVHAFLHLAYRPVTDQLAYLAEKCHLPLMPLNILHTIHMHSCSHRTVLHSRRFGYLIARGRQPCSLERQLAARLRSPILLETPADALTLSRHFDAVVAATGNSSIARALGYWQELSNVTVKGAVVLGRFDPTALHIFFDTTYAGKGFGYLAPFDRGRACLLLSVGGIGGNEMDDHWEMFLEAEKLHYPVVEIFEQQFHAGRVTRQRQDNIFLVGNSGGFTDNLLGLGLFSGLISGVLAARAIAFDLDYEALVKPLLRHIDRLNDLRLALDHLDNRGLNRLVCFLGLPGVKHLIYNSSFDIVRRSHRLIERLPWLQEERRAKYAHGGKEIRRQSGSGESVPAAGGRRPDSPRRGTQPAAHFDGAGPDPRPNGGKRQWRPKRAVRLIGAGAATARTTKKVSFRRPLGLGGVEATVPRTAPPQKPAGEQPEGGR